MTVHISDYDPGWPRLAATARADLVTALPGLFSVIEHIGSTAVPGLAAKPIVDLMAATVVLADVVASEPVLGSLGYQPCEIGMANRLFYVRDTGGCRSHHLHVVTVDTWDGRKERMLRDHLLTHPDDVVRYAELKQRLRWTAADSDAYTVAKTPLIQEMMDRARAERGLPSIPVWE